MASEGKGGRTAARRRSRGLWAAATLAAVIVGVVGFFGVRAWLTGGPRKAEAVDIPAPDITALPKDGASGPEGVTGGARKMNIQFEDRNDPSRLEGELHAAEMEPLEGHRFRVREPEAWLYLKNGWMLYVQGDSGNFYIPDDQKQPERGVLQGHVRCEGYPPRADGTRLTRSTLVRGTDKTGLLATTDSMTFDSTQGTFSTDDRVVVTGDQVDFAGTGLRVTVNQVKEQLNVLDVARGEYLKFRPKDQDQRPAGAPAPGASVAAGSGGKTPTAGGVAGPAANAAKTPIISMYLAQFTQAVVVSQGERTCTADQLDVWARLVDNELAPGAIAEVPVARQAAPAADRTSDAGGAASAPNGQVGGAPAAAAPSGPPTGNAAHKPGATDEITMTWTGPLHVRPLEADPQELKSDQVSLRFTALDAGLVTVADPAREMTARCATLEYGATSRRVVASGRGPSSVNLVMKGYQAEAGRVEADLGLGTARVPGPGAGRNTETEQRVSWAELAEFVFRMETDPRTGKEQLDGLKTAILHGKSALADRNSTVTSDLTRAEFAPSGDQETTLDHVYFSGSVTADAGRSRSLTSDEMDVAFRAGDDAKRPEADSLNASGHVIARDGPSILRAGELHADLARGDHGSIAVTKAEMKQGAHFEQDDGVRPRVEADADQLKADPVKRIVDLIADDGGTAKVVRGGSVLTGPSIRLNGLANGAWVVGPGTFVNGPDKRSPDGPLVTASWTKEMNFDDTTGILTAAGAVSADIAADALSMDKIRAERVRLEMSPGRSPSEGDQVALAVPVSPTATGAGDMNMDLTGGHRKLIRARAEGAVREEAGGANATVESWRYIAEKASPGGKRPERVMYLEGPLILGSQVDGTLDVDGDGRLLVVDRRYFDGALAGAAKADEPGIGSRLAEGSVGGSVFTWMGSMHLDKAAGTIHFLKRVRLNHKPQRDSSLMELECEELTAKVHPQAAGQGADAKSSGGELESADARGAVWGRSSSRELIADRLYYDTKTGKAEAFASDGNQVTVYDRVKAATMTASHIMWDLNGDKIQVVDPGAMTAPK